MLVCLFTQDIFWLFSLISFSISTFTLLLESIGIFIEVVLYFKLSLGRPDIFSSTMIRHLLCPYWVSAVFWVQGWNSEQNGTKNSALEDITF